MPIYEYECPKCNTVFSDIVPIGTDEHMCIKCGTISKKIMSTNTTFILKGTGWYATDYKKPTKNTTQKHNT